MILTLSAIITPPDIFSQVMVCFPLIFLYEIGISISRNIIKKEKARFEKDDDDDDDEIVIDEVESPEVSK